MTAPEPAGITRERVQESIAWLYDRRGVHRPFVPPMKPVIRERHRTDHLLGRYRAWWTRPAERTP